MKAIKFCWRITKYNPIYRSEGGTYLKDEWYMFAQIGKKFDDKKLTFSEYLKAEDAYIKAILSFMEDIKLETLCITQISKNLKSPKLDKRFSQEMIDVFNTVKVGSNINTKLIEPLSRLSLREKMWCKLESQNMYVHFGWDFYMYIGSTLACVDAIFKTEESGLYVEPLRSPYLEYENYDS